MSSIETNSTDSPRFPHPGRRDPNALLAPASVGEPTRVRVDPTPRATEVPVHPDRPGPIGPIAPGSRLDELVDDFKLALVHQALAQGGGNHRRAAALLGIHRSSFTRMLHRLEGARRDRIQRDTADDGA